MSVVKKVLPFIILFLFVTAWYLLFYLPVHPTKVPVTPSNNYLSLYIEPKDGKTPLINAINNASKEVLMTIYLLSDKEVIGAIEAAKEKGVNVNVLIECHPFGGAASNAKTLKELTDKKIPAKCTSDKFALTHEKSIVIDDNVLFILTQNLATSSFKNREYDIEDRDIKDVNEVHNIFWADWNSSEFKPTLNNIIESPNNSRAAITALIESAKNEIDIEMEEINDPAIMELLSEKGKSIQVNIITPKGMNKIKGNVNAKILNSPYIHAKLIIADQKTAYVGSINLSSQSMDENRELGIILNQGDVIQTLMNTFQSDWAKTNQ